MLVTLEGLPDESRDCTVSAIEHAPAATVTGAFVNTSFEADPATRSVPVLVTVPPPVACAVNVYVPAATAPVVVTVRVVAVTGHTGGLLMLFAEKDGVAPLGKPKVTENVMMLLLPWSITQIA